MQDKSTPFFEKKFTFFISLSFMAVTPRESPRRTTAGFLTGFFVDAEFEFFKGRIILNMY